MKTASTSSITCGRTTTTRKGELTARARQFIRTDGPTGTRELLVAMNQNIRERFAYAAREEEGTQTPRRRSRAAAARAVISRC